MLPCGRLREFILLSDQLWLFFSNFWSNRLRELGRTKKNSCGLVSVEVIQFFLKQNVLSLIITHSVVCHEDIQEE